jgi:uncharacterized membrane protein
MYAHTYLSPLALSFTLSLTLGMATASAAYPEYRVTIVGPPNSTPTDINNAGAVVGTYPVNSTDTRSFANFGRGVVHLGTMGGVSADAVAINDRGQVLGNWRNAGGQSRGYIYYQGRQRAIPTVSGRGFYYVDMNNAGYILASGGRPEAEPLGLGPFGFLRAPDGSYRDIGTLPYENAVTQVEALNNRNQVTGESGSFSRPEMPFYAFLWSRGAMRNLGSIGYTPNYGLAINDRGQVSGYVATETFREALATIFSNGRVIRIDTRPASANPFRFSVGQAINNHGHVVGSSDHLGAFVYRGKRMESLSALVDPKSGWNIYFPRAINDGGQIAASGVRGGVSYAVRLDLIRPHALGAPDLGFDAQDVPETGAQDAVR